MSPHMKWGIAGVAVALFLLVFGVPAWLVFSLVAVAIAIPTTAWFMLDESQRRRYREIRRRRRGEIR